MSNQKNNKAQAANKQKELMIVGGIALVLVLVVVILAIAFGGEGMYTTSTQSPTTQSSHDHDHGHTHTPGDGATLETAVATHNVTIEIEDYGTIKAELYGNTAPGTVANFVSLAEKGFYNGLDFHRIIEGFMMQGGEPADSSQAVPSICGEFTANGFTNNLKHLRGVLSMARTSVPDSASSQFFIMHQDNADLDGQYAAFGMVTEGLDVVDAICAIEPAGDNGYIAEEDRPVIKSLTVEPA